MSEDRPQLYEFGEFQIDSGKRLLLRGSETVPLTPKVFETLLLLVKRQGEVLDKKDLMAAIWPDTSVEENNLNQNISALRRVLGEARGENRFIATVPGKGYCFTAEVRSGSVPAPEESRRHVRLAVLPFENLGAGPEREYLADGLTEETIAAIGQIDPERFSVIGRTSVMAYKRTMKTVMEIGRELDASYVIESSLRAEGDRLRITSKLIRVQDQLQLWSASYDSEPSSMLAFQRELSVAIAEQVRLRLSPGRLRALANRQTRDAEAYDLYLHGRHFWNQLTGPTTRRAMEYFTRATALDPGYALAWAGLADCLSSGPVHGDAEPAVVAPRARDAAERAVAAEPELAEAQTAVGNYHFWISWRWHEAEAAYRRAIAMDANLPLAHRMLGVVLSHSCRHDEARVSMQRARELDPLYVMHQSLSSQIAFAARDFEAALYFAKQALIVDPEFWIAQVHLAQVAIEVGEFDLALDALNKAGRLSGGNSKTMAMRGYVLAKTGQAAEAAEILATMEALARQRYVPPYTIALLHAGMGDAERAMEWLERAVDARDVHMVFVPIDAKWDEFRGKSRFEKLMARCEFDEAVAGRR